MSKAVEQLPKKRDASICNDVNATDNTEISPVAYAVETPRGEHPSLQFIFFSLKHELKTPGTRLLIQRDTEIKEN